jgi:phosphatidylglycerol:prolipoprotein diacylglycerol transferase
MPPEGIPIVIGSFHYEFRFYGFILMLGAVAGAWLASRRAKERGYDPEIVWDLLVWLIIGGVIGARLWHIFLPSKSSMFDTMYYLTHPLDAINLLKGGLGIPGAVIGGVIALYFYSRKHGLYFAEWLDIAAPARLDRQLAAGVIFSTRNSTARQPNCPGQFLSNPPND